MMIIIITHLLELEIEGETQPDVVAQQELGALGTHECVVGGGLSAQQGRLLVTGGHERKNDRPDHRACELVNVLRGKRGEKVRSRSSRRSSSECRRCAGC